MNKILSFQEVPIFYQDTDIHFSILNSLSSRELTLPANFASEEYTRSLKNQRLIINCTVEGGLEMLAQV